MLYLQKEFDNIADKLDLTSEEKKNIFQPIFTLKELVELYIDSPDNFGDSVYKKGFIYDEFEDYDSFNVFSYSKNNYTVTYSIEKHSLKLIGVSYNTDDYNEYTYLISECEKEGYKKEVKVFNLKNVSYIEFSGSTFNVLFYESPDKTKLKYNIHIKNK